MVVWVALQRPCGSAGSSYDACVTHKADGQGRKKLEDAFGGKTGGRVRVCCSSCGPRYNDRTPPAGGSYGDYETHEADERIRRGR